MPGDRSARFCLFDFSRCVIELRVVRTQPNVRLAKVRRLYDIANVLSTINLITKVTDPAYRGPRPAFQYIGPRTEIIHHAESESNSLFSPTDATSASLDVVDFINSENTKSNSKHSLFDHFKRNLFLNCTIPRFDPRNGLLGLKSALDMSGRSSSGVTVTGVYSTHPNEEFQQSNSSDALSICEPTKKRKFAKTIDADDPSCLSSADLQRRSTTTTKRPVGRPPKKAKIGAEPLLVPPSESNSLIETLPSSPSPALIKRHPKDLQDINVDMLTYQMRSVLPSISNAVQCSFYNDDELLLRSNALNEFFSSTNYELIETNPLPSINSFMNKNYLL